MKTYNVIYETIVQEEATIQANSRTEAIRKLEKILNGVEVIEAWELKNDPTSRD